MRTLRTFDPWKDFGSLQERINRLFDDTLRGTAEGDEDLMRGAWAPAVDIHDTGEGFVVTADLPGVKKEDIVIDLKDGTLSESEREAMRNELRSRRGPGREN